MAQLVEHHLAKVGVAGSNPVVRSRTSEPEVSTSGSFVSYGMATWPSGKAEACKAFTPGSNPGVASIFPSYIYVQRYANRVPLRGPFYCADL